MIGSLSKNSLTFMHSKRIYLFGLLTAVLFLFLICALPQETSSEHITKVSIEVHQVEDQDAVKDVIIEEVKNQLTTPELVKALEEISHEAELVSSVLANKDISVVRNNLLGGALTIEPLKSSSGRGLGFSVSLRGDGSNDEEAFVLRLANSVRNAVTPNDSAYLLQQLQVIRENLENSRSLNLESRKRFEVSIENYASKQKKLFTKTRRSSPSPVSSSNDWELQNLIEQRRVAYDEYKSNASEQFDRKEETQKSLQRRIEYLDQQIKQLEEKNRPQGQFAEKDSNVEQASFLVADAENVQPFEIDQGLSDLKTEIALAFNKLDLAESSQSESLTAADKLTKLLQRQTTRVQVSDPSQRSIQDPRKSPIWIMLGVSGIVSAVVISRIGAAGFGSFFKNGDSVERALQLPVLGTASLPVSDSRSLVSDRRLSGWVQMATRTCELILMVTFVIFFLTLLVKSDFSMVWFQNPVQQIQQTFHHN